MIHYILQGPKHELEIHEDKIRLVKKGWFNVFTRSPRMQEWKINQLSQFEVTVPKFMMISGKIQWQTFNGDLASFRFSTTPAMVKRIETYLQKQVVKNHEHKHEKEVAQLIVKPRKHKREHGKKQHQRAA